MTDPWDWNGRGCCYFALVACAEGAVGGCEEVLHPSSAGLSCLMLNVVGDLLPLSYSIGRNPTELG